LFFLEKLKESKLLANAAVYGLANVTVAMVPFLMLPVLTRYLDNDSYGRIGMFSFCISIFSILVGYNSHGALLVRYGKCGTTGMASYISSMMVVLLFGTLILFISTFFFSDYLSELIKLPSIWIYLAVIVAASNYLILVLLTYWQGIQKPLYFGFAKLGQSIADFTLSLVLVLVLFFSWQGRLIGMAGASFLLLVISAFIMFKYGFFNSKPQKFFIFDILRFGLPLIPHSVAAMTLSLSNQFMITQQLGVGSTGVYIVALQLGMIIGILVRSFNKSYSPWLMKCLSQKEMMSSEKLVRIIYLYFLFISIFAVVLTYLYKEILPFWVGDQFHQAIKLCVYIVFGNAFTGMYYMMANFVFFKKRTELLSISTSVVSFVTVVIGWNLIAEYGVDGAGKAFVLGQFLIFLSTWILAQCCYPMPWLKSLKGLQFK
jgi:O-antigen/teichoic acid export membrane protein